MKTIFLILLTVFSGDALSLPVTVDPTGTAFGGNWGTEWNTAGNFENWTLTQAAGTVAGGVLQATASGTDSGVILAGISGGPDLDLGFNDYIEVRVKVPASYAGSIQIFYGTTGPASGTGFSAARVLTIPAAVIPHDGAFHTYRLDVGLEISWRGTLTDLRIDPVDGAGSSGMAFAIDYIRIGDLPGDIYLPNLWAPVTAYELSSKHFRFIWDANRAANNGINATVAHGCLRNAEEIWQLYVKLLGYREPAENPTVAKRNGNKYKVNFFCLYDGYYVNSDSNGFGFANIDPSGLRVDPPSWILPHEITHVFQIHNTSGYMPGEWWESHANYCRERWVQFYQSLFPNQSGIDQTYLWCAHMMINSGRDYYLSWPFYLYLDQNPDSLANLGEGTMVKLWQQGLSGEFPYTTLGRVAPGASVKDIVGHFARRGVTYNYSSKAAIQATLATQDPTTTARFQFTDLVRRTDDATWWRVPFEIAPMQGAYSIHELVPQGVGNGRVVTVNLHGLPNTARGADWRASFVVIANDGTERYSTLWSSGSNSVTLSNNENKLYLVVAGAPDTFFYGGHDDSIYPYRSAPAKARFPYELQITGATPRERDNGATTGLIQHANGLGYKASTASVDSTAYIGPNARVLGVAQVRNSARVEDFAVVTDSAQVLNNAVVSGHALVRGNAIVRDNAKVRDWGLVESGTISLDARVIEHAYIKGGTVTNTATAKGCAGSLSGTLSGNAIIDGDYGDYFYGRDVSNGVAFGLLPYNGVPDSFIRPLPTALYASYDFATAHDSRALDQYGVTDAYVIGSPAWTAADAKRSGFLTFDGTSQYVALDRSVADFRQWTFTAWVKPLGGAANQAVLWLGATPAKRLCFTPDDGTGHAKFSINNGGADQTLTAPGALTPGVWTHVAVTLDGVTGTLYLNGASVASAAIATRADQILAANTAAGSQQNYLARSEGTVMGKFRGALDDVHFYTQALAAADIAPLQTGPISAGNLYVDLRASDVSLDAATWINKGTIGDFTGIGSPAKVANVAGTGVPGVQFDGTSAYNGPGSLADLDGSSDRTIEVWAYNPALASEETMVAWGHRGSTRRNMAFNFGSNPSYGAAGHWADDAGWGATPPSANAWHHLAYTYNGGTAVNVYIDGVLATTKTLAGPLDTFPTEPLNIGCQRDTANGARSLFFSGYINSVRIHGGVLTAAQIAANASFGPAGTPTNAAPTLATVADQIVDYGTPLNTALTVSDADTSIDSLTLTGSAANATLVPPGNIVFTGSVGARNAIITPAANVTGTTAITLTVSDGAATATRTFNFTILNQAETWRRQNFGITTNTGSAADTADPDGDGISNKLERAFGGNPNIPSPGLQPAVDTTAPLLSITYFKAKSAADLTFTVQESSDLTTNSWTTSNGTSELLIDGAVQRIRFTVPAGLAPRKFLRLQITPP